MDLTLTTPYVTRGGTRRPALRRGSVLVAVLLFVVLLSFVVLAFVEEAVDRIRYYGLFHHRDDLRIEAYSGLEISLAVLNLLREYDGSLWAPAQGWTEASTWSGYRPPNGTRVDVRFRDESGRFPLATATEDTVRMLLEELEFADPDARRLTDCLLDWMDDDDMRRLNGFDGDDYRPYGYRPANRPLQSWDELILVEGFRAAFWDEDGAPLPILATFTNAFSLLHTGPININAAQPIVMRVLEKQGLIDLYALDAYRSGYDGIVGTADDRLIRGDMAAAGVTAGSTVNAESSIIWLEVEASRGEARFRLEAVVAWAGSNPAAGASTTANRQPDSSTNRQRQPRTSAGAAAELGYPFTILLLSENRKF
jgi:type II secretory pathway component PulK